MPGFGSHRPAALCSNGFWGAAERFLRLGHDADRRGVTRTGRGASRRRRGQDRPVALGGVLGLDLAPEVKTIRRKITALAGTGKAEELLAAMAARHVTRLDATNPDLAAVFYVDGQHLAAGEVIYRMGSRWRQENYFRYARMHFDLDSHDAYATTQDDPTRMVPNPAKKKAHRQVLAARAALLTAQSPPLGQAVPITTADPDAITADLRQAQADLDTAKGAHRAVPTRLPLAQVNPGQQVLDIQTKLLTHAIRMAAFTGNSSTPSSGERVNCFASS